MKAKTSTSPAIGNGRPTGQEKPRRHVAQDVLMKALSHPLRVRLLTILSQRVACPRAIAEELGLEIAAVSYHCRQLEKAGLVEIVHEEPVRGSIRHDYRAVMRPFLDDAEWAALPTETREAISAYGLGEIFQEVAAAMSSGSFDARTDRHLSRTALRLDEAGWQRVAEIQNVALQEILDEQVSAVQRMTESGERPVAAVAAMFCFQPAAD